MKKTKPSHSILGNIAWMLGMSWKSSKSVPFVCVVMALLKTAQSVVQLFASPTILSAVELHASLGSLLLTIIGFTFGLMLFSGLYTYVKEMALYPRIAVRQLIIDAINEKIATTSYPNTEDAVVKGKLQKAKLATNSNWQASERIWTVLTTLLTNLLGFVIYLAVLTDLHPAIAVVIILTSVAGFFAEQHFHGWGYRHKEEETKLEQEVNYVAALGPNRVFAKDMRIFGMADWLKDMHKKALRLRWDFENKVRMSSLWADVLEVALSFLRNGVAYAILLSTVLKTGMPASAFVLYFSVVSGFSAWMSGILENCLDLGRMSLDLCQIREYLDTPEIFRMSGGSPLEIDTAKPYELRLDHVSFRYPEAETDTIHDLNLTIRPGEKLAIVGENGAGKTTLIKLLCGFYDPTEGRVLLNGQDIREFNRPEYYRLFSAVFQEYSVLAVTLRENVTQTVGDYDEKKMQEAIEKAGLTEKVQEIGFEAHITQEVFEDGIELSGGQTQRMILARALYKDGPVLVLDEPTAALDPIAENDIYQKYAAMTEGRTSVFISHRLASTRFCDRILMLDHGRIAEEGTHESLLAKNGAYAEMFNIQKKYYQEERHDEG